MHSLICHLKHTCLFCHIYNQFLHIPKISISETCHRDGNVLCTSEAVVQSTNPWFFFISQSIILSLTSFNSIFLLLPSSVSSVGVPVWWCSYFLFSMSLFKKTGRVQWVNQGGNTGKMNSDFYSFLCLQVEVSSLILTQLMLANWIVIVGIGIKAFVCSHFKFFKYCWHHGNQK